ncbi:metal ABC transporter substrate-binding protein [Paenibacillus arenosi]|uniref:Zinc ABC transporter substrate-binding protein n=1 Tax=Paenibacillus arenosi TaxID=2774142 RepID=A0ABR9AUG4_9BACL|nr:zinc ABC transporter substrate-binding protein [Paenibacillus arenosi]MBD8497761.1 zinc ABC transporter substrate-binding protein [Paenibacillus arenosi]
MKRSKTWLSILLGAIIMLTTACGNSAAVQIEEGKVNVVTSFYPLYYMAKEIGGEHVNVVNLIPSGVEPHDWTPKSVDLQNVSKAQIMLYQGAGFEGWIEDFKNGLDNNSKVKLIEASKGVTLIEGTNAEEESGHEHGHDHGHNEEAEHHHENEVGHSHEGGVDPHTWVSPKSAIVMAENVKQALIDADSSNKSYYEERHKQLHDKLVALDKQYADSIKQTSKKDIVVSHHAFGYLARDYGIHQHAIMGISPSAEPRAQDILRLKQLVEEKQIKYIFFEELVSDTLAKTLASEANVETLVLSPLEGLTKEQEAAGENYLTLMERNLQHLLKALQ